MPESTSTPPNYAYDPPTFHHHSATISPPQLSTEAPPPGYEDLPGTTTTWGELGVDDRILVGAGQRLFYLGSLRGRQVTLMLTSEAKTEAHHLLTPLPLVAFKEDHLPARLLSHSTIVRGNFSPGGLTEVWGKYGGVGKET